MDCKVRAEEGVKSNKAQKRYYHKRSFSSCFITFFVLFCILNSLALSTKVPFSVPAPLPEGGETQAKGECNKGNKEINVKIYS